MTIKEAAKASGLDARTIRFYEMRGLLSPRREPASGYRRFTQADLDRLAEIRFYRSLGFGLADIGALQRGDISMEEALGKQIERLQEQLGRLRAERERCLQLGAQLPPLYSFEDVRKLPPQDAQAALREMDSDALAAACLGASPACVIFVERLFPGVTQRARALGPLPVSEVEAAQQQALARLRASAPKH